MGYPLDRSFFISKLTPDPSSFNNCQKKVWESWIRTKFLFLNFTEDTVALYYKAISFRSRKKESVSHRRLRFSFFFFFFFCFFFFSSSLFSFSFTSPSSTKTQQLQTTTNNKKMYFTNSTRNSFFSFFFLLSLVFLLSSPQEVSGGLTVTQITWGIMGLDSNSVTTGPNNFPLAFKVCNTGTSSVTNALTTFTWTTTNSYINLLLPTGNVGNTISLGTITVSNLLLLPPPPPPPFFLLSVEVHSLPALFLGQQLCSGWVFSWDHEKHSGLQLSKTLFSDCKCRLREFSYNSNSSRSLCWETCLSKQKCSGSNLSHWSLLGICRGHCNIQTEWKNSNSR